MAIVLLIDDDKTVLESVKQTFLACDQNLKIVEARSSDEALITLSQGAKPHLVLFNPVVSSRNGFEVLRRLQTLKGRHAVVLLSGIWAAHQVAKAFKLGAAAHIPKGSDGNIVRTCLKILLASDRDTASEESKVQAGSSDGGPALTKTDNARLHPASLGLTGRQVQILKLLIDGLRNKEIAKKLRLAEPTVKSHMSAILRILKVSNRTEAALAVTQLGLRLGDPRNS